MKLQRLAIASLFIGSGILHFVAHRAYESVVPGYLPNREALVAISGAAEIAGGVGALLPSTRRAAGYGLLLLLVAVFPANLNMAVNAGRYASFAPAWALWLRLPLQPALMWWVKAALIDAD